MSISSVTASPPVFFPSKKQEQSTGSVPTTKTEQTESQTSAEPQSKGEAHLQQDLSKREQQQVNELTSRDREVKAHEAAHKAAGGGLTGPARFSYTTGPDGKRYAVGGEVSIDTSKVPGDPQATLIKANRIRAAALAPAEPSGQDHKVAAQASQMAAEARLEMAKKQRAAAGESGEPPDSSNRRQIDGTSNQLNRQPLYDSAPSSSGNIVDDMV